MVKKKNSSLRTKCVKCKHILRSHEPVQDPLEIGGKCIKCECEHYVLPGPTNEELAKFYEH